MLTLESDVLQRCLSAQPAPTALQRLNRCKGVLLLRDLAADLPPHRCDLLPAAFGPDSQVVDRKRRQRHSPPSGSRGPHPQQVALSAVSDPVPYQFLDPQQPARLLRAIAALFARRQHHNAPLLHTARTMQEVATEECRILGSVNHELGTHTPAVWIRVCKQRLSLWCQQQSPQSPRSLLSRVPPDVLASGAQGIAEAYVRDQPITVHARPSHVG